jgi:death-on-curing protein
MEPRWLTTEVVRALHDELLATFGGAPGVRDVGLLESALARPRHLWSFEPASVLPRLAAAYGFGLARDHPFVDGNKRVAVVSVAVFLALGGRRFDPDEADEVRTILALAAGELDEPQLAAWVAAQTSSSPPRRRR